MKKTTGGGDHRNSHRLEVSLSFQAVISVNELLNLLKCPGFGFCFLQWSTFTFGFVLRLVAQSCTFAELASASRSFILLNANVSPSANNLSKRATDQSVQRLDLFVC